MTAYRVLVGLNYPTAPGVIKRLLAGDDLPPAVRAEKRAEPGDIVSDLPAHSIPALLEKACIEEVADGG